MKTRRLLPLLALLALPASLLLAQEPAAPAAPAPRAADQAAESEGPALGLEDAIRLALSESHLVRIQSFGIPIARANLTLAWGAFDPHLTGSYSSGFDRTPLTPFTNGGALRPFSVNDSDSLSAGLEGDTPWGMSYRLGGSGLRTNAGSNAGTTPGATGFAGLTLTQPLLRDLGLPQGLADLRIARNDLRISEWEFRQSLTSLVNQVIAAYTDVLRAEAYLKSSRRVMEMAHQLRLENDRRRAVGSMSDYDVLSAEARTANREDAVISAEASLQTARNALLTLISRDRSPALLKRPLRLSPVPAWAPTPDDPAADLAFALSNRPDYQKAKLDAKRGGIEAARALSQALPKVDLVMSHGYNGYGSDAPGLRSDLRDKQYRSSAIGLNVSIPLSFATERGRYRGAKLRKEQAEAYVEKFEQDIMIEIGNAAVYLDSARRRVEHTRHTRELNEQALVAEQKLLRAGTGSTFNVLYQQELLGYAEVAEAQAVADLVRAGAEYDRATGRTLQSHRISPTDSLRLR